MRRVEFLRFRREPRARNDERSAETDGAPRDGVERCLFRAQRLSRRLAVFVFVFWPTGKDSDFQLEKRGKLERAVGFERPDV